MRKVLQPVYKRFMSSRPLCKSSCNLIDTVYNEV